MKSLLNLVPSLSASDPKFYIVFKFVEDVTRLPSFVICSAPNFIDEIIIVSESIKSLSSLLQLVLGNQDVQSRTLNTCELISKLLSAEIQINILWFDRKRLSFMTMGCWFQGNIIYMHLYAYCTVYQYRRYCIVSKARKSFRGVVS